MTICGNHLAALSDIATFSLKSWGLCFWKTQQPKLRERAEWPSDYARVSKLSRLFGRQLMASCFFPRNDRFCTICELIWHPYTSVNWWWILTGLTSFVFKNRITARTLQLAIMFIVSSISNGCQWLGRKNLQNNMLIDFCRIYNLMVTGTWFKKKNLGDIERCHVPGKTDLGKAWAFSDHDE